MGAAIGAVVLLLAAPAGAVGGFKTGTTLVREYTSGAEGKARQAAYVAGVLDGERIVAEFAKFRSPICLPPNVPTGHLSLVVHEWLEKHPERLNQQAANLVLVAVKEAFPCQP